jgi:hypothetical protein
MSPALYRLYIIDASGRVVDLYEPECVSDEEAYHKATAVVGNASVDVWQGDRWIAWMDAKHSYRLAIAHHVVTGV